MIWMLEKGKVLYEYDPMEIKEEPLTCFLLNGAKIALEREPDEDQKLDHFKVTISFVEKYDNVPFWEAVLGDSGEEEEGEEEEVEEIKISAEEFKESREKFHAGYLTITNNSNTKVCVGYVDNEFIILSAMIEKCIYNELVKLLADYGASLP